MSRNRTRTSYGFQLGQVYSAGLNKSYGSALGSGYSFSSGYTPSYSSYLSRVVGGYYANTTSDLYKKSYTSDNFTGEPALSQPRHWRHQLDRQRTNVDVDCFLGNSKSTPSSSWRRKSTEGYRDSRSLSRDYREHSTPKERFSTIRSFTPSRDFTPNRDYTPSRDLLSRGSIGVETNTAPQSRLNKFAFHKSASNLFDSKSASRENDKRLTRSNSYHDLQDVGRSPKTCNRPFGYGHSNSNSDLTRSDLYSSRQSSLSDISRSGACWRGSNNDLNGNYQDTSRPFTRLSSIIGLSGSCSDLGYISSPASRRQSTAVSLVIQSQHFQSVRWRH